MGEESIEERIVAEINGDSARAYLFPTVYLAQGAYDVEKLVREATGAGVLNQLCYLAELTFNTAKKYGMDVPVSLLQRIFERSPVQAALRPLVKGFPEGLIEETSLARKWNVLDDTKEEEIYEFLTVYV